jgi:hypothetical protein
VRRDGAKAIEVGHPPQRGDVGDVAEVNDAGRRVDGRCGQVRDEARRQLGGFFVEVRRIEKKPLMTHGEPGALLPDPAFPHHRHQVAAAHRVD